MEKIPSSLTWSTSVLYVFACSYLNRTLGSPNTSFFYQEMSEWINNFILNYCRYSADDLSLELSYLINVWNNSGKPLSVKNIIVFLRCWLSEILKCSECLGKSLKMFKFLPIYALRASCAYIFKIKVFSRIHATHVMSPLGHSVSPNVCVSVQTLFYTICNQWKCMQLFKHFCFI